MDWDDLRFFEAVATAGSVRGAAKTLGVNHSTVVRRVGSLEQVLKARLFERSPTGYLLTPAGEELRCSVARMQAREPLEALLA